MPESDSSAGLEELLRSALTIEDPPSPQAYGDLRDLNRCRRIADAVPEEVLSQIVSDFLGLLATSAAVYEVNGDYASGFFSSGWCRHLDAASRNRCGEVDNETALGCGRWLCHESCWTAISRRAIEEGEAVDEACKGGLRIYALPIRAGDEIVGVINFGYGSPPTDDASLDEIARAYGCPKAELLPLAQAYMPRPAFVVDLAKRRLAAAARTIGTLVELADTRRALAASETRYRELFENAQTCVAIYRPLRGGEDFEIVGFNRKAEATEGIDRKEILGRPVTEAFPGVEALGLLDVLREVAKAGRARALSPALYEDERGRSWRENFAYPLPSGEIVCSYADVTERVEARLALVELVRFVDENPSPVLRITRGGKLLYANPASEILIQGWIETDEGRVDPMWLDWVAATLDTGQVSQRELRREERRWLLTLSPVAEREYVNVYASDVTALKAAEAERRRLERQVQQAQKLESLGVLAGGIAHDFNNLLTGIMGNTDLALEDLPPASLARRCMEDALETSRRAAELCAQMLAYSGRGRFVIRRFNPNDLVSDMAQLLKVSISKKAELRLELHPELDEIDADPTQIRQIVMNLLTNASESLENEQGTIRLRTGHAELTRDRLRKIELGDPLPAGRYVFIEVSDSGCGMDEKTIERMFEPFYSTKFTGRGLGLAASLGIIRGHRGAIEVESEPGKGSNVRILLPVSTGTPQQGPVPATDRSWTGKGVILIVDDEETVRSVACRMVKRLGFESVMACDGEEALARFDEGISDLRCVLLDLTMPRLDGQETFRALHRRDPKLPIVLSSGYNEQEAISHFTGMDLAGFVQKPYELDRLRTVLRTALGD